MTILDALIVTLGLAAVLVGMTASQPPEEESPRATFGGTARGESNDHPSNQENAA